ncbi:MAG: hypothetical protein K2H03_08460 [Muribaculaceae bacterium]|nr:hypothetical protein [Muribaculaceae bacterium]MDE5930496.1 hypothetical protein [Muribaculaceae bacterium]
MESRFLAQRIITPDGIEHRLSILCLDGKGGYRIEPFAGECASTVYVNGILTVGESAAQEHPEGRIICEEPLVRLQNLVKKS